MEKLFFDLEFTGLHQKTTPISIGIVSESGKTFYAEFSDFEKSQVDDWIEENVINNLLFQHHISKSIGSWENWISDKKRYSNALEMALEKKDMNQFECIGKKRMVVSRLSQWLSQFDSIQMWGDCLSYDWVLFCELFGHAFDIPKNIFYIPFDICVLLNDRIGDADVNREKFIGEEKVSIIQKQIGIETKHNALFDAFVIRECYKKISVTNL